MVVDTSAVVAVLLLEADSERFAHVVEATQTPLISAATVIETGIVLLSRSGAAARNRLNAFLVAGGFEIEPVTAAHSEIALDAFERYGKGLGSGVGLNYGACFAYALARARDDVLLFKGNDFSKTDVKPALP